jgi:hypothetical protein
VITFNFVFFLGEDRPILMMAFLMFLDCLAACDADSNQNTNEFVKSTTLIILAVSLLGIGIGQTAIATLGIPYIDDNVQSKQSPLYMAITIGVRILGPALGYYLGSLCMRISYNLTMDDGHMGAEFIGAWYLGEFYFFFLILIISQTTLFLAPFFINLKRHKSHV